MWKKSSKYKIFHKDNAKKDAWLLYFKAYGSTCFKIDSSHKISSSKRKNIIIII